MRSHTTRWIATLAAGALGVSLVPASFADDVTDQDVANAKNAEQSTQNSIAGMEAQLTSLGAQMDQARMDATLKQTANTAAQQDLADSISDAMNAQDAANRADEAAKEALSALGQVASADYREGSTALGAAAFVTGATSLREASDRAQAYRVLGDTTDSQLQHYQALSDVAKSMKQTATEKANEQAKVADKAQKAQEAADGAAAVLEGQLADIESQRDALFTKLAAQKGTTAALERQQQEQKEAKAAQAAAQARQAELDRAAKEEAERTAKERKAAEAAEAAQAKQAAAEQQAKAQQAAAQKQAAAKAAAQQQAAAKKQASQSAQKAAQQKAYEAAQAAAAKQAAAQKAAAQKAAAQKAAAQKAAAQKAAAQKAAAQKAAAQKAAAQKAAAQKAASQKAASSKSSSTSSSKSSSSSASGAALGNAVVAYARQFVGVPYVWGKYSPLTGWDCCGFTYYVYKHFGINTPRATGRSVSTYWGAYKQVSASQARPGDLLWWPGHVGIYTGNGMHIAAWNPAMGTQERAVWGSPLYLRVIQ